MTIKILNNEQFFNKKIYFYKKTDFSELLCIFEIKLTIKNMEIDKKPMDKKQFTLKSGAILGGLQLAWLIILYLTNKLIGSSLSSMMWIIAAVFLYLNLKAYRDVLHDGVISYGKSVGQGFKLSALAGVFVGAFYFILIKFLDPDFVINMIIEAEEAYLNMGMPESMIEDMSSIMEKSITAWTMFFSGLLNNILYGLIITLIISIFIKKSPANPFEEAMKDISEN